MLQGVEENAGREPDTAVAGAVSVSAFVKDPFLDAAALLADLCDRLDDGEPMSAAFLQVFGEAMIQLAEQIDERKAMVFYTESMLAAARAKRDEIDAYVQRLKAIEASLKENTLAAIMAKPDLPWRDTLGRKLSLSKNSQPSLKLTFDVRDKKTVTNVVDNDLVDLIGIDRKYIKPVGFLCLDTETLKADLVAGAKLHWASVETGRHVRGWEKTK